MGDFGGRGGTTAGRDRDSSGNTVRSRDRRSAGALALGLALVMGAFVLPGEASGVAYGGGWIPVPPTGGGGSPVGDEGEPPPKPPTSIQDCFEDFVRNQDRCVDVWCEPASFLWFDWLDCQTSFLNKCFDAAMIAYKCCLMGGPPCEDL